MERLKILYPLSMSWVEFVLTLDIFQCFMIGMEEEFTSYEIVTPILQGTNDGIELFVVGGVLPLGFI